MFRFSDGSSILVALHFHPTFPPHKISQWYTHGGFEKGFGLVYMELRSICLTSQAPLQSYGVAHSSSQPSERSGLVNGKKSKCSRSSVLGRKTEVLHSTPGPGERKKYRRKQDIEHPSYGPHCFDERVRSRYRFYCRVHSKTVARSMCQWGASNRSRCKAGWYIRELSLDRVMKTIHLKCSEKKLLIERGAGTTFVLSA